MKMYVINLVLSNFILFFTAVYAGKSKYFKMIYYLSQKIQTRRSEQIMPRGLLKRFSVKEKKIKSEIR